MGLHRKLKKEYIQLEEQLTTNYRHLRANEIVISPEDFKNGYLTNHAFTRLRDECWYIPYGDEVVIKAPTMAGTNIKEDLQFFSARALDKIKKDRMEVIRQSIGLFVVGLCMLTLLTLIFDAMYENVFVIEFVSILSWVFVWSSVGMYFIDQRPIQDKRFTLLQLLSAQVVMYDPVATSIDQRLIEE